MAAAGVWSGVVIVVVVGGEEIFAGWLALKLDSAPYFVASAIVAEVVDNSLAEGARNRRHQAGNMRTVCPSYSMAC